MLHKIISGAIILWTLLACAFIVAGVTGNAQRAEEVIGPNPSEGAEAGYALGTGLAAGTLFCIWAAGAAMLLVLWLVTRPRMQAPLT